MRPIIGITVAEYQEYQGIKLRQYYYHRLWQADALPILLPPLPLEAAAITIAKLDGLLLSGGGDIDPRIFGEQAQPLLRHVEYERDIWEIALVKAAWHQNKPVLGICRGMQLINVALGGNVWQDLTYYPQQLPAEHDGSEHQVFIIQQQLATIMRGNSPIVNSFHHQAVRQIASVLEVTATAVDGVVEAISAKDQQRCMIGVQWHPERMDNNGLFALLAAESSRIYAANGEANIIKSE